MLTFRTMSTLDHVDLELLAALSADPRATVVALAERLGLSRNTVQARMARLERSGVFLSYERAISSSALGFPIEAFISVIVRQADLPRITAELAQVPEIVQAHGLSGQVDLLVRVACRDTQHLFDTDARILAIEGVERTETSLVMGEVIGYRVTPLMELARRGSRRPTPRGLPDDCASARTSTTPTRMSAPPDELDRRRHLAEEDPGEPEREQHFRQPDERRDARADARHGHDAERVADRRRDRRDPQQRHEPRHLDAREHDRHGRRSEGHDAGQARGPP